MLERPIASAQYGNCCDVLCLDNLRQASKIQFCCRTLRQGFGLLIAFTSQHTLVLWHGAEYCKQQIAETFTMHPELP